MTLKPPESEEAWEECMSAFLDKEMPANDMIEFERMLEKYPLHAAQMERLRLASGLLREWKIDPQTPDPAFLRKVRGLSQSGGNITWRTWFGTLRLQPVLPAFLTGILAGILFMTLIYKESKSEAVYTPRIKVTASGTAISPAQAHMLLETEELRVKVLNELDQMNIGSAMEYYNELKKKYPESRALRDLYENRTLRLLQKGVRLASY